ncbi:hypothetical protein Tco_1509581 [Tanacetum coccineum]
MVKTRHDDDKITNKIKDYPSFSNLDRTIHFNVAYNLMFFCMIGYEHVDANLFPLLFINMMSRRFYNSIMKDKLEFKGKSVVEAFMNAPIFDGTFFVVTDFAVIENMDRYHDEEMGDVIVGSFVSAGWWRFAFPPSPRAPESTSVSRGSSVLGPSPLGVDTIVRLSNVAEAVSVLGTVSTGGATSNARRIPRACPARSRPCHAW